MLTLDFVGPFKILRGPSRLLSLKLSFIPFCSFYREQSRSKSRLDIVVVLHQCESKKGKKGKMEEKKTKIAGKQKYACSLFTMVIAFHKSRF